MLCRGLRIGLFHLFHFFRGHLGQVPDKRNQSPTVVILIRAAPSGHSGEADAVVDDVIQFSVREVLCSTLAHVWRLRIEVLSDLSFPPAVIPLHYGAISVKAGPHLTSNSTC